MSDLEVLAVAILFLVVFVGGFVWGIAFCMSEAAKHIDNGDDRYPD